MKPFLFILCISAATVFADDDTHTGFQPKMTKDGAKQFFRHQTKLQDKAREDKLEAEIQALATLAKKVPSLTREEKLALIEKEFQFETQADLTCLLKYQSPQGDVRHVEFPLHLVFENVTASNGGLLVKADIPEKEWPAVSKSFTAIRFQNIHLTGLTQGGRSGVFHNQDGRRPDPFEIGNINTDALFHLYKNADGSYLIRGGMPGGNPTFYCPRMGR